MEESNVIKRKALAEGPFPFSTGCNNEKPVDGIISYLQKVYGQERVYGEGYHSGTRTVVVTKDLLHDSSYASPFYCDLHIFDSEMKPVRTINHIICENSSRISWHLDGVLSDDGDVISIALLTSDKRRYRTDDEYYSYTEVALKTNEKGESTASCRQHPFVYSKTYSERGSAPAVGRIRFDGHWYVVTDPDGMPRDQALELSKSL